MKLRTKILAGFGIVLLLMVGSGLYGFYSLTSITGEYNSLITHELTLQDLARQADSEMLQARRREKDFLLRFRPDYAEEAAAHATKLHDIAVEINHEAEGDYPQIAEKATLLSELATQYATELNNVIATYTERGFDNTSGVWGELTAAADAWGVQLRAMDGESAFLQYLLLRRWEKDYIRTQDQQYSDNLFATLDEYARVVSISTMSEERKQVQQEAVDSYRTNFTEYRKNENSDGDAGAEAKKAAAYDVIRELAHVI